jgi:hypothetical protein
MGSFYAVCVDGGVGLGPNHSDNVALARSKKAVGESRAGFNLNTIFFSSDEKSVLFDVNWFVKKEEKQLTRTSTWKTGFSGSSTPE